MQLTPTLIGLLGLATFAVAKDNMAACARKNKGVVTAIGIFCQQKNMMIPSSYAHEGRTSPDLNSHVAITGNCAPAMWVPQEYCFSQFWDMCAKGGKHGGSKRKYGDNGCQHWELSYNKHFKATYNE